MAMPFRVFGNSTMRHEDGRVWWWCLRCGAWVPAIRESPGQGALPRHVEDHLMVYDLMRAVGRGSRDSR
jgi:hypothetical protein